MAKKRIFGNKTDPCCENCSYGKLSADSSVVLCRRGGVMPPYHSCRHFHYDPLKRTPRRQKPLDAYDAAAFSLSGLDETVTPAEAPKNAADNEMLTRLHNYLNTNDSPDAQTILELLDVVAAEAKTPAKKEASNEKELAVEETTSAEDDTVEKVPSVEDDTFEETTSVEDDAVEKVPSVEDDTVEETTSVEEKPTAADRKPFKEPSSSIVIGNAARATPETIPSPVIADNTPNIFEDLKRLQADAAASSTRAALQGFSLKLGHDFDDEEDTEDPLNADADVVTLADEDDTDEDDMPQADDLILNSPLDPLADEDVEAIEIAEDGTVTTTTKKISDLSDYS